MEKNLIWTIINLFILTTPIYYYMGNDDQFYISDEYSQTIDAIKLLIYEFVNINLYSLYKVKNM